MNNITPLGAEFGQQFSEKHGFSFANPPRPEIPVSPDDLARFKSDHQICQAKFDGSAKVVHVLAIDKWCVWTRHGEWRAMRCGLTYYVSGPGSARMIKAMDNLAMFNGDFTVAGEWLDKAKPILAGSTENAEGFIIWDVLEYPGIRKLFDGYKARMEYLRKQVGEPHTPTIPAAQHVAPSLHIVIDYDCKDPADTYRRVTKMGLLYEGLVFRSPHSTVLDHRNLFKVRRAKAGIYKF